MACQFRSMPMCFCGSIKRNEGCHHYCPSDSLLTDFGLLPRILLSHQRIRLMKFNRNLIHDVLNVRSVERFDGRAAVSFKLLEADEIFKEHFEGHPVLP